MDLIQSIFRCIRQELMKRPNTYAWLFMLCYVLHNGHALKPSITRLSQTRSAINDGTNDGLPPCKIKVVGVGGGGGNAVDGMTPFSTYLPTVEFWAMNTDVQAMSKNSAPFTLNLGTESTRGLGAGGKPETGKKAAEESRAAIRQALAGADMVFVTAGLGGGTGTGAAPVVAEEARAAGALTVGVVTVPFGFEGRRRARQAEAGLAELEAHVDTLLVVENDRLAKVVPQAMTVESAFLVADDVLRQGVVGTSEIILKAGLVNVDFADVRAVMRDSGRALIGIGRGVGRERASDAALGAVNSPLLDQSVAKAQGVVVNIVGGEDLSLTEVSRAVGIITETCDPEANIIVGALVDKSMGREVAITVVATGIAGTTGKQKKSSSSNRLKDLAESIKKQAMLKKKPSFAGSSRPIYYEKEEVIDQADDQYYSSPAPSSTTGIKNSYAYEQQRYDEPSPTRRGRGGQRPAYGRQDDYYNYADRSSAGQLQEQTFLEAQAFEQPTMEAFRRVEKPRRRRLADTQTNPQKDRKNKNRRIGFRQRLYNVLERLIGDDEEVYFDN